MKKSRIFTASVASLAMAFSMLGTSVHAEDLDDEPVVSETEGDEAVSYDVTFLGSVEDNGQSVSGMIIDFGEDVKAVTGVDNDTFTVNANQIVDYGDAKGNDYAYGNHGNAVNIVKTEVSGSKVTVYFQLGQVSTLTWLTEGRNYPAILDLAVKQNKDITLTKVTETPDKRELETEVVLGTDTQYTNTVESYKDLVDAEVDKFVAVDAAVDYQIHEGTNDALIVWFHGNGEGSFGTDDELWGANAAQMLANRGTVAWVTDEAQSVFGDATVMAFQAPSMWYLATADDYLSAIKSEIDAVVAEKGISADEIYVSGCSAGGYMTTRMIITYPDLFKAAMINCPALDIASLRNVQASGNATEESLEKMKDVVGATPTDEELAGLKNSRTAIWLVQGETDGSVDPENCSKRIWNFVSEGETVTSAEYEGTAGIASGFTTYETEDGKYKLSLYETVNQAEGTGTLGDTRLMGRLLFAEDYNLDGELEKEDYSDHWSWIYTLRNNPEAANGDHIWQWAKNYKEAETVTASQKLVIDGEDWGPAVTKTILTFAEDVTSVDNVAVSTVKEATNWADLSVYNATEVRTVTNVYLSDAEGKAVNAASSKYVTVEMYVSPNDGSPFRYDVPSGSNKWCEPYVVTVTGKVTTADGTYKLNAVEDFKLNHSTDAYISTEAQKFDVTNSFTGSDGIVMPYGMYTPAEDDHKNALIIWLHGAGEGVGAAGNYNNDNFVDLLGNKVTALVSDEFQNLFEGAYVITPQAQTMWMDGGDGAYQNGEKGSMYRETLKELIDNVVASNPDIDADRVIIGGCSNGGYMTMEMIVNYPGYFLKAYPICEAFYDENITDDQIKALAESRTAVWFTYSRDDTTVDPTKTTIPTSERLAAAGGEVHVTSYDHVIDLSGRFTDENGDPYMYSGHWSWIYFDNNNNYDDADASLNEWVWLAQVPKKADDDKTPTKPSKPGKGANTGDYTTLYASFAGLIVAAGAAMFLIRKRRDAE